MRQGLFVGLMLASFATMGCIAGYEYTRLRGQNRANLLKLERGMTADQVSQTMGNASASGVSGVFSNPYKRELVRDGDGAECEVIYYYTEQIGKRRWEDGVTPVVMKDGKLVGVGWRYLEASDLNVTIRAR